MTDFSQELKKDFLDEAFDLLDNLEKCLLELEKNPNDDKAINEVFRVAHTIKGGAGTVGFDEIQSLTHIMEDVLDMVRKKKVALKTENISLLLKCRDELEHMLTSREKDEVYAEGESEEIKKNLLEIKNSVVTVNKEEPVSADINKIHSDLKLNKKISYSLDNIQQIILQIQLTNYDLSLLNEFIEQGKNVYLLCYNLDDSYEMKDVSGFQIYALLNDFSEIIKIYPSIQELETKFYNNLTFIINTEKDEQFIRDKTYLKDMVEDVIITKIIPEKLKEFENIISENLVRQKGLISRTEAPVSQNNAEISSGKIVIGEKIDEIETANNEPIQAQVLKNGGIDKNTIENENIQKRNIATLRVESWKIDELINLLGEMVITKANFMQINAEFDRITGDIKTNLKDFISGIVKLNLTGDNDTVARKNSILFNTFNDLFSSFDIFSESIQRLNRISSSLQENVMNMRMVPIQMVFSRFPRLIRDMADKLGKKIELVIEGVETEIDKGMVDDIFDPLIHLLRNAVDHGIELPQDGKRLGKQEIGKIVLKAVHEGDSIAIEVSDDGKGIDVETIKKEAIKSGFISRDNADKLSQKELLSLIFLPGLSTAKKVSDLSGRGVGMDVVKKKIEEIGGNVGVSTVKGKGTRIVIRLPLTLAIIQGLLIVVNNMHYVIPVASVEETVIINLKELKEINSRLNIELRGKYIPVMSLKKYFYNEVVKAGEDVKEYCIIAKYGDSFIGILVNEVIGEQDIVIKSLNTKLIKSPGISAATIIGNGDIGYIIDTSQIINQYFKGKS